MTTEEKLKEMLGDYYEMGVPGSPNAAILQNMLGANNELRDPQSENEALLKLIYEDVIGAVYDARDEAQAVAEAAESAAASAEAEADRAEAYADRLINVYPTDTASGSIASFPDGADGMPVKSLVVNVEPNQDLHGYDNPWPAGGGKNLLGVPDVAQTTRNGVTYRVENGLIYLNGTATGGFTVFNMVYVLAEDTYTFSAQILGGSMSGINNSLNGYNAENTRVWLVPFGAAGTSNKVTQTGDLKSVNVTINSGAVFTNAVIGVQIEKGSNMTAWAHYSNICPITGWDAVTVYVSPTADPEDATTYPLTLPSTVYGGTLTYDGDGVWTVTSDLVAVDMGSLNWTATLPPSGNNYFSTTIIGLKPTESTSVAVEAICSAYKTVPQSVWFQNMPCLYYNSSDNTLVIGDRSYSDAASFKAAVTGQTICYKTTQPTTYTLTTEQVVTLLGQNNIFADCGDTSVTYRADIQLYIDKLTGSTEDDMTADSNIPNNTYFLVGNTLYKSTAAIAAGATIAPGTNCTKTDLAAALNALQ